MKSILTPQRGLRLGVILVVVLGLLGAGFAFIHHVGDEASPGSGEPESNEVPEVEISVKTVYPRQDKSFTMTEKRPADVQPYFETDLQTRVPGLVEWIPYDVGSQVEAGNNLIRVSVPDLEARSDQRKADLYHAEALVKEKKAAIDVAKADYEAALSRIKASEARLRADQSYRVFRKKQAERFAGLQKARAIEYELVDEQQDRYHASIEAVTADEEKVSSAKADAIACKARISLTQAELEEAQAKVEIAKAEQAFAQAMLDYSIIRAPYDGVIVRRNVDPGHFVQNAGDSHAKHLLTVQRSDIITIVMRLPDHYAPYVTPQTEAIFETSSLPGVKIHGKVTRYPPSLVTPEKDRTMLVEVDLWNRSPQQFEEKKNDRTFLNGLKRGMPGDPRGGLPVVPKIEGNLAGRQILPGMYGEMTLLLRKFENVYMLPSQAVINQGGIPYIYVVKDGKAQKQPVKEQVNDGKLVYVELLDREGGVIGDLTGKEEVIVSNQGELSEGQPVKPVSVPDWKELVPGGDRNDKR